MMTRRTLLTLLGALGLGSAGQTIGADSKARKAGDAAGSVGDAKKLDLTDAQWKARLTSEQYYVLRREGTESPGSSPLNREKRQGNYHCAGCDLPLFASATKFESGTGWPSFYAPLPDAVGTRTDYKLILPRTEYHCVRCE